MAPKIDFLLNYTIPDIDKVVQPYVNDRKVTKVNLSRLTAPGENYLSLVLRVDLEVENQNGVKETISAVAKRLPPVNQHPGFNFNGIVMKNEIKWYSEVVPILKQFANENGIETDYFPTYMGSRLSLNPESQEADSEAILLIKNLIPEGYVNEDRHVGFDLEAAKTTLKTLAALHATVLGMKFKKPKQFDVIKAYLEDTAPKFPPGGPPPGGPPPERLPHGGPPPQGLPHGGPPGPPGGPPDRLILEKLNNLPSCQAYKAHVQRLIDNMVPWMQGIRGAGVEPWSTVAHSDFWGNNIMVAKSKDKPVAVKFLDFQIYQYSSYARDVGFFMLTSLSDEVLRNHFEELLRFYHEQLTSILSKIGVGEPALTYEDYKAEMKRIVEKSEVYHALFMTCVIYASKNNVPDHLTGDVEFLDQMKNIVENIGSRQEERLTLVLETCIKQGWI